MDIVKALEDYSDNPYNDALSSEISDYVKALEAENKRLCKLEADFKKIWCKDPEYCQEILAEKEK